jgi:hypothetical protein
MLIAYSAKAGSTAADGDGTNSPFTVALSKHLTTPGLDVRRAFGFVRDDVLKTTNNRQEPFVYGSLGGDDVPLVPAPKVAPPVAAASPQADMRRDYELALQIGNKGALNAFLAQYPDGFYANLAKLQIEKLSAEEARVAATEKARVAEQERVRLAAEGAQKTAQAKADADAKAAEQARIAAEKAKEVAQQQAAAGEAKRAETEKAADSGTKVATVTLTQPAEKPNLASLSTGAPQADVTKSVQSELRRVGCLSADADGNWNTTSQRSLTLFNRYAKTKFDTKLASTDALDAIKTKTARVCPLVCDKGYKAEGDNCVKITCAEGTFLNDDNQCEKPRDKKPVAKRDTDQDRPAKQRPQQATTSPGGGPGGYGAAAGVAKRATGGGGGGMTCDVMNNCRPVAKGCHVEYRGGGGPGNVTNAEVCN